MPYSRNYIYKQVIGEELPTLAYPYKILTLSKFSLIPNQNKAIITSRDYRACGGSSWILSLDGSGEKWLLEPEHQKKLDRRKHEDAISVLNEECQQLVPTNNKYGFTHYEVKYLDYKWPLVSPDGKKAAIVWSEAKNGRETYKSLLYMLDLETNRANFIEWVHSAPLAITPNNNTIYLYDSPTKREKSNSDIYRNIIPILTLAPRYYVRGLTLDFSRISEMARPAAN